MRAWLLSHKGHAVARAIELVTSAVVITGCVLLIARSQTSVDVAFADGNAPLFGTNPLDGSPQPVLTDGHGRIQVAGFIPANITENSVTQVKRGDGLLRCVTVNKPGRLSFARVLDWRPTDAREAKAVPIAEIDTQAYGTWCYDAMFSAGLWVETSGTVPADITVGYR